MIGDGLSNVGFGAPAIAAALNMAPLVLSLPVVRSAAFSLLREAKPSSARLPHLVVGGASKKDRVF